MLSLMRLSTQVLRKWAGSSRHPPKLWPSHLGCIVGSYQNSFDASAFGLQQEKPPYQVGRSHILLSGSGLQTGLCRNQLNSTLFLQCRLSSKGKVFAAESYRHPLTIHTLEDGITRNLFQNLLKGLNRAPVQVLPPGGFE